MRVVVSWCLACGVSDLGIDGCVDRTDETRGFCVLIFRCFPIPHQKRQLKHRANPCETPHALSGLCATETTARDPNSQSSASSASGEPRRLASASSCARLAAHSRAALLWPRARASWANCCCVPLPSSVELGRALRKNALADAGKGSCRICRVSFASKRAQCSRHKPANSCRYLRSEDLGMFVDGVNALTMKVAFVSFYVQIVCLLSSSLTMITHGSDTHIRLI